MIQLLCQRPITLAQCHASLFTDRAVMVIIFIVTLQNQMIAAISKLAHQIKWSS